MAKRPIYHSRVVGDRVMTPAELRRLHKYILEVERVPEVKDDLRAVIQELWPELAHKLSPKKPRRGEPGRS